MYDRRRERVQVGQGRCGLDHKACLARAVQHLIAEHLEEAASFAVLDHHANVGRAHRDPDELHDMRVAHFRCDAGLVDEALHGLAVHLWGSEELDGDRALAQVAFVDARVASLVQETLHGEESEVDEGVVTEQLREIVGDHALIQPEVAQVHCLQRLCAVATPVLRLAPEGPVQARRERQGAEGHPHEVQLLIAVARADGGGDYKQAPKEGVCRED
mmetsp:Transcript_39346/g.76412  ORF Transcript_39346/g.76412 Transcript_39346/m.76412 type:complete len:216 (-) Transcript_39346:580-1227(-)